jgi:predicted CoA-binding protein
MTLDSDTIAILRDTQTIAVVGLSPKPYRASNTVARYLVEQGYGVVPINPKHDELLGLKAYPDLLSARTGEGFIDIVDIFRAPDSVPPHVDEAIEIRARLIWMQLGVLNEEAALKAREAGIRVVMDECLKIRHGQLRREGEL